MNCELLYRPVSTIAQIQMDAGEAILVEPGAMVGMSTNMHMDTGIPASSGGGGGLLGKLAGAASRMLTGESFFQNTYTAQQGPGELLLTHKLPGDMAWIDIPGNGLKIQSTAYIACSTGVQMQAEMGGYKTFFSGEGLFVINATASQPGQKILLGAFGGIQEMQVDGNLLIDNGHLVAWEGNLAFNLTKASGGWISSFLSQEGMVCRFTGQGKVWIQTRNPNGYGSKVGGMLPARTN
jgi:uncharacterized protein (TIGR00266 family)